LPARAKVAGRRFDEQLREARAHRGVVGGQCAEARFRSLGNPALSRGSDDADKEEPH